MVFEVFQYHNYQMAALVNQEYAPGTLEDIKLLTTHPIFWNHEFIAELCVLARKRRKYDHYTTVKYPANFKKIVIRCLKNR